ncbi:MAG: hypothetical protein IJ146_00225 [Kiritimatiellae bacterium]|nr:hypothetical protein [Kiritimatiellia bacterium]
MKMKILVGFAALVASAVCVAETTYTPGDPNWGTALTVVNGDTVVIDGGEGSAWSGAVTIASGGTLKTRGKLTVVGASALNAGGFLDVETGSAQLAFGNGSVAGSVTVRAGAELKMNASEVFKGAATTVLHVYGTLNCLGTRQRIDNSSSIYFHDGSTIIGPGDGNGGLDFGCTTAINRIIVDGAVTIDTPVKSRSGGNLQVACCENARVLFNGGFLYGGAANGKGNVTQVAATAAEGNASGTCANSVITVGASDFRGKITLISKAVFLVTGGSYPYSIESTGDEVEVNVAETTPQGSHFVGLPPPVVSATAVMRLTGGGFVDLGTTTPALPIIFDGATLCMAGGAPIALAPGSGVASATTIGVDGLAPNATETIFTGADASFDVSKLSVVAMHMRTSLSDPATVALSGGDVTATVGNYDASSWIEPYLRKSALLWLDASDAANFIFKDGEAGTVKTWKDLSESGRNAVAYVIPSHDANWGSFGVADGVPAYLMGEVNSGIDLAYTRMETIRSAFFVMSIRLDMRAFWLGDTSVYDFHRGSAGQYSYTGGANPNNSWYLAGEKIADTKNTAVPTDRRVYSVVTAANGRSDRLTCDRNCTDNGIAYDRHAGRELSELIVLPDALSDADRQAIEAHLAAKWMGSNPSAALANPSVYTFGGEFTVEGDFSASKSLVFLDGSSLEVTSPISSGAMVKTAGTVTLPSGPLPVTVDARLLPPGTYTVLEAAGGITSPSQFSAAATVAFGASATFAVSDGKLTMTVVSSSAATSQTWRPASSADLGWNATSVNWLLDSGTPSAFVSYITTIFDGGDTVGNDVVVEGEHVVGPLNVVGAKDYTFKGDGVLLGTSPITLGGTGTITLDGASVGDQDIVITDGQKVVLGVNAAENSLGTDTSAGGGTVTIRNGGQFNANSTETAGNNSAARFEITQHKTFVISGDGPDGRGAFVNDALDGRTVHNAAWGPVLRRIELADDATIGGNDRFDVRVRAGTTTSTTPGIYGPGKKLTIKNTGYFGLISQPIEVESVTITDGGVLRPEAVAETQFVIPGGITLDNGILHGWGSTFPATVPIRVGAGGGTIFADSGTSTIKGPIDVPANTALAFSGGSATIYYAGGVDVKGSLSVNAGTHILAGPTQLASMPSLTGGGLYIGSGFSKSSFELEHAAGSSGFFTGSTAPTFDTVSITATGGAVDFRPQAAGILDVPGIVTVNQTAGTTYMYGPNANAEYGIALQLMGSVNNFSIGLQSSRPGTLELKEGTDLSTKELWTGNGGSGPSAGRLIIDHGAKVSVTTDSLRNGHWSGTPGTVSVHKMEISGELDASPAILYDAYDSPRAEVILKEGGLLKVKGITMDYRDNAESINTWYYGNGVGAGEGHYLFVMEGGRLEMGASGFNGSRVPGMMTIDLRNGELANGSNDWGCSYGCPVFFGYDKKGGKVTFDMGERLVNWNQGLSGASDLTIKGAGTFAGLKVGDNMQGAMLGRLTVENAGDNDLRVTSAFAGGLTLASGTRAQVAKYSKELYPFAAASYKIDATVETAWSYPFAASGFWDVINKYANPNMIRSFTTLAGRGEFYVPAEKAGVWTFAGCYDDWVRFDVDGVQVCKSSGKCAVARGTVDLAEGWHKFTLAFEDCTGACGPNNTGWRDRLMSFGFVVGESTSTSGNDYLKFEPGTSLGNGLTLQMRPIYNACVWNWQNGNGSWDTTENWAHIKCIDSVAPMHKHSGLSDASSWSSYFSGKASKFEGWFKVENGKEGEWTFKMGYDDNKLLKIDGEELIRDTSWTATPTGKKTLDVGWHRWEARVQDGSGGWGPSAANNGNTLSFIAPGEIEKQWNETNLVLAAILGDIAVIEPTGIYKELDLGEGSSLTSSGEVAMPIFGVLKGTGELTGAFEFAGDANGWEVTGVDNRRELDRAVFSDPAASTFRGLKALKATFNARPKCASYILTGVVSGLAPADVAGVAVTVTDGEKDYSDKFLLTVEGGRLVLKNSNPGGTIFYLR